MTRPRLRGETAAILPWVGAALLWFGVVAPMRADQENRLSQQSRTRRDRLKAEHAVGETAALRERLGRVLGRACRTSSDPAALRQRSVAATAGLSLSPFTLSVTGGADGGALVEASATRGSALELTRRLGDPSRGGFLRSVILRDKGARWTVSAATGVLESVPADILPVPPFCSSVPDPGPAEPGTDAPRPKASPRPDRPPGSTTPAASSLALVAPTPEPPPTPPFTLVAFLNSEGRPRVSIRVRDEVRVVSVGESVDGWACLSIDRDEGATFRSPANVRVVLKARLSQP